MAERFSTRHGYQPPDAEITIRFEAPTEMREIVIQIAQEEGLGPSALRGIICGIKRVPEDPNNWSEYPNINEEVSQKVRSAEWWEVYDFIEEAFRWIQRRQQQRVSSNEEPEHSAERFQGEINKYFRRKGIGWQLVDGKIETRGPAMDEEIRKTAIRLLEESNRPDAAGQIEEAHRDLSRRPNPDLTGAVHHSLGALECVVKSFLGAKGAKKETLGELIKKRPDFFPQPLDQAVDKLWGFGSQKGRHIQEGKLPSFEDAELVVTLAAGLVTYLLRRNPPPTADQSLDEAPW